MSPPLVHQFLENSAARLPDKIALVCGEKRLTYREVNDRADQLARSLMGMGLKRHDRVVVFLENSAEAVVSIFGILKAGAVFIVPNHAMKAKKLNYILNDSGAGVLITHTNKVHVVKEAVRAAPKLERILWLGNANHIPLSDSGAPAHHLWEDVFRQPTGSGLAQQGSTIDVDLAAIIYTSGSTGEPKGVMSAHRNVAAAARSITQYLENKETDVVLNALPLSFDYGLYQILMSFLFGGTVILEKSFAFPYKILHRLVEERATGFPIVPTMAALMRQMDLSRFDFSSLRYITNTAAALPVSSIRKLQAVFPHVKIFSMYGLTECKRVSYLPPDQLHSRPESVGIPIPNEEVFIVDEEGNEVGPGRVGELVVRGSNVMQGYWNAPEETARVFRPGRYRGETLLYTGDLFKRDEEGYLYFFARKDDLIKTKGERVSPKEIENALCSMEKVAEAAVIGVPDDLFGQAIKAFIVPKNGTPLSAEQVMKHCQKELEPFMTPKFVEFLNSLPKSPSGKINKKQLK